MTNPGHDQKTEVRNFGQIALFCLPANWHEVSQEKSPWDSSCARDFSPDDDALALLSVYFRGYTVASEAGGNFQALLRRPPHVLSGEETGSINQVLSKMADEAAFELRSIVTAGINGRQVLIIDGLWRTTQTQFHGVMIASDASGQEIQEIFFEAPLASFVKHLPDVVRSIRTIAWIKQ